MPTERLGEGGLTPGSKTFYGKPKPRKKAKAKHKRRSKS